MAASAIKCVDVAAEKNKFILIYEFKHSQTFKIWPFLYLVYHFTITPIKNLFIGRWALGNWKKKQHYNYKNISQRLKITWGT